MNELTKADLAAQRQMNKLTKDDWEYIAYAVQDRFRRAKPKLGEFNAPSKEFEEQEKRIMTFLLDKAKR